MLFNFWSLQKISLLEAHVFFYLSFLEIDLSNLGILNHFHIIIEPAFNLNNTKIYFSACLQNSRHFEFQISSTQGKFIDFSQKRFFDRESFHNGFFQRMGGQARPRLRGPGRARTPIRWKNSLWNDSRWKKRFCEKSRNLPWVELIWNSECLEFCKQAEK